MRRMIWLWLLLAAPGFAEVRQGSAVSVGKNDRVAEDLYLVGGTVAVEGPVDGDLIVVGGDVRVDGDVTGDVLFLGGRATLRGKVGGSVRGLGGQLTVDGPVHDDVGFVGGTCTFENDGVIGRDALLAVGGGQLRGPVGRDVTAGAGTLEVNGRIAGSLEGQVGALTLADGARIGGHVRVATDGAITRAPGAEVGGPFEQLPLPQAARPLAGAGLIAWLRNLVGLLVLAAVWVRLFPGFSRRAIDTLGRQPGRSFAVGALTLLAAPVAAATVFALGLVVGGWWLGAVGFGAVAVAAAIAAPLVGHFVGASVLRPFKREGSEAGRQVIGLTLLTLLAAIPGLGLLVVGLTAFAGVGAQVLALRGRLPVRTSARLDALRDPPPPAHAPGLGVPS